MGASSHAIILTNGMPSAIENWYGQLRANVTRRAVHLDTGANNGRWTRSVWKRLCLGDAARERNARGLPPHLLVLVEAQPKFVAQLEEMARNSSAASAACRVEVLGAAAWTHDGTVAFSYNRDPRGAYAGAQKQMGQRSVITVKAVDYGAYLRRTLAHADNVFMKLDVEAGEFRLLPWWLSSGSLCNVDNFLIEWHFSLLPPAARLEAVGMRLSLAHLLERGCPQRPNGRPRLIQHDELQLSRHHNVPGLWERARWHNGQPKLPMEWSKHGAIMAQTAQASGTGATGATTTDASLVDDAHENATAPLPAQE